MTRVLVLFACLLMSPIAVAEQLPIEYFVKSGDYLDVQLSPSGTRLAARARVDETVVLLIIDRETNEVVGGARAPGESEIHTVHWVSDERLVFSYAEDVLGFEAPRSTGELYAMDYTGKGQELLAGYRASDARAGSRLQTKESDRSSFYLVDPLEDNDKFILVIEYPWSQINGDYYDNRVRPPIISRLNVRSGRKRVVERLQFRNAEPYATRDGSIRFVTYETEEGFAASAYRENEDAEWQPLTDVFELSTEMTVEGLNAQGTAAFLRGRYGTDQYYTIYRLDFEDRTFEPIFTDLDADIVDWVEDEATGEIVAGMSLRGKTRYHYPEADSEGKRLHRQLAKAFKGRTIRFVSGTRDGSEVMLRVTSDVNPGEYYIFNTETKQASFFWANKSWIDPRLLRPMLVDEVETDDGLLIPVRLTLPEGDGPAPLIVYPHGGPHGPADLWEFDSDVQLFANRGYAVLQVNFRGSGYFGSKFRRAGYREWGGKMIDDIIAATDWAVTKPEVDGSRVCAYGASYGAYASYMLAIREPELLNCVAGYVGVYDLEMMYTKGDIPKGWGGVGYLERVIGRDEAQLREFSPVHHADKIKAPMLLVHGDADIRAPIDHAKRMRKAIRDAGKQVEYIEIDQSGHGAYSMKSKMELYEGLLGFLETHL
ncbi:MAG: prolyl oligopeptidase family serine peptidase [Pseudomonadota bacterium]